MTLMVRILLLLIMLLSACTPAGRAPGLALPGQKVTATPSPMVRGSPTSTAIATARAAALATQETGLPAAPTASTLAPVPSPTAIHLPTSAAAEPPTGTPAPATATLDAAATPSPTVTLAPGAPTPSPTPGSTLMDQYLPRREKVAETEHFIFYAQDGYFPVDQAWFIQQAELLYDYVSQRVQAQAKNKIWIAFMKPETRACPVRGLASQDNPPTVLLYADASSTRNYLLAVMSHELGHAIPSEGFQGGLPDNIALTEGLASWASGKYWNAWQGAANLDDLIRRYIRMGQYEPIHENIDLHGVYPWQEQTGSSADCLARRDRVYSEWASFLGYLIDTYGWDKAHQLFHNPPSRHENGQVISFPPDYEGIYGKALNQLEWEWLNYLQVNDTIQAAR